MSLDQQILEQLKMLNANLEKQNALLAKPRPSRREAAAEKWRRMDAEGERIGKEHRAAVAERTQREAETGLVEELK